MNKRILSILLCLTLVTGLLVLAIPVSAASANEFEVTVDKTTAAPGDEVTISLVAGNVTDLGSICYHLAIPEGLTFVEKSIVFDADAVKEHFAFDEDDAPYFNKAKNANIVVFSGYNLETDCTTTDGDFVIGSFKCTVDEDATGTLTIDNVDPSSKTRFEVISNERDDITSEYTCKGATITIETPEETDAPTDAPVVTEAPTDAPVVTEAPTDAPVVTEAPTDAPVVTEAPTDAPVVTEAPTDAPEVHNLVLVPEVPATATENGTKAHYECTECGKIFWDATGDIEITDPTELIIPATGEIETITDETTTDETTADETTADETTADETTADETIADETIADETATSASEAATEAAAGTAATPDSTKDSAAASTTSPTTGDSTHMYLWMLIMLASLAGVAAVVYTAKRKGIFTK